MLLDKRLCGNRVVSLAAATCLVACVGPSTDRIALRLASQTSQQAVMQIDGLRECDADVIVMLLHFPLAHDAERPINAALEAHGFIHYCYVEGNGVPLAAGCLLVAIRRPVCAITCYEGQLADVVTRLWMADVPFVPMPGNSVDVFVAESYLRKAQKALGN